MTKTAKPRSVRFAALALLGAMLFGLAAPHAFAAGEKQSYTANAATIEDLGGGRERTVTQQETVTYQVGSPTITVERTHTETYTGPGYEILTVYSDHSVQTYTLSAPLQAATRQGDWNVIFDVPAGTMVKRSVVEDNRGQDEFDTWQEDYSEDDQALSWFQTKRVFDRDEDAEDGYDSQDVEDIGWGDGRLTVAAGKLYQMVELGEAAYWSNGGVVFRGV